MTDKTKNKLTSCKFWVTLWSMGLLTFIVIANRADFTMIAQWLCAVPLAYIGCNVWQKKILTDAEN